MGTNPIIYVQQLIFDLHALAIYSSRSFFDYTIPSWAKGRIDNSFCKPFSYFHIFVFTNRINVLRTKICFYEISNGTVQVLKVNYKLEHGILSLVECEYLAKINFSSHSSKLCDLTCEIILHDLSYPNRAHVNLSLLFYIYSTQSCITEKNDWISDKSNFLVFLSKNILNEQSNTSWHKSYAGKGGVYHAFYFYEQRPIHSMDFLLHAMSFSTCKSPFVKSSRATK